MNQKELASAIKKTPQFISLVLSGKRRPKWKTAKLLGEVTGTDPSLWMEGKPEQMQAAMSGRAAVQ